MWLHPLFSNTLPPFVTWLHTTNIILIRDGVLRFIHVIHSIFDVHGISHDGTSGIAMIIFYLCGVICKMIYKCNTVCKSKETHTQIYAYTINHKFRPLDIFSVIQFHIDACQHVLILCPCICCVLLLIECVITKLHQCDSFEKDLIQ